MRWEYPVSNSYKNSSFSMLSTSFKNSNRAPSLSFIPHNIPTTMDPHQHRCASLLKSSFRNSNIEKQTILALSWARGGIGQCCVVPKWVCLRTNFAVWAILNACWAIVQWRLRRWESQGSEGRGCISDVGKLEIGWVFLRELVWRNFWVLWRGITGEIVAWWRAYPRSMIGGAATARASVVSGNKSNVKIACTKYGQLNSILERDK